MHLVIDARRVHGRLTGMGRYAEQMVRLLPAVRPEWQVTALVTEEGRERLADAAGVALEPVALTVENHAQGDPWRQFALPRLLRRWGATVFFDPGYMLPALTPGVRRAVTIHDLTCLRFPESNSRKFNTYMRAAIWLAAQRGHLVLCDSQFVEEELHAAYPVTRGKTRVVHLGVEPRFAQPACAEERRQAFQRLGLPERFVYTNALIEPRKNLTVLLEAMAHLVDAEPSLHVVIGGAKGWRNEALERMLGGSALAERVHFTGWVDEATQRVLYQNAVAYVLPSLYEGFGLPALEALAAGTRLICSHAASLPEVAGDHAWYFQPNDPTGLAAHLKQAAQQEPTATEREAWRTYALGWSWERTAEKLATALEELA